MDTNYMWISKFQIKNYKSFRDSGEILFDKGFNILIGKNNSGKTALLDSLKLSFVGKPHKSLASVSHRGASYNGQTTGRVSLCVSGGEARDILLSRVDQFSIAVPVNDGNPNESAGMNLLHSILSKTEILFQFRVEATETTGSNMVIDKVPSHDAYQTRGSADAMQFYVMSRVADRSDFRYHATVQTASPSDEIGGKLSPHLIQRIYKFDAQRIHPSGHRFGNSSYLATNASNLPEVLSTLQGQNNPRFHRFNKLVTEIFPDILHVSSRPKGTEQVEVAIWMIDPLLERDDLAIPLEETGTGIGQVLAILYVVINSDHPTTIIIDEPNSFLHPAAARKLIEILREQFKQHQYIMATHSSEIIRIANPSTLHLVRWVNGESIVESVSPSSVSGIQKCLVEVGVKLSDVYGYDRILWVEGQTEEECYRMILEPIPEYQSSGISIAPVRATGDFDSRRPSAKLIWDIYQSLSHGNALLPPAVGFLFDRETRSEAQITRLEEDSSGKVKFLPRRMLENYLINPRALAEVLNRLPRFTATPLGVVQIENWIMENGGKAKYESPDQGNINISDENWLRNVHAGKLLTDLVSDLSAGMEEYRKTKHSVELVEWLIGNDPGHLNELRGLLRTAIVA